MTRYECLICGRIENVVQGKYTDRKPIGWEKDSRGRDRCPKHREINKALTTLGELILAKQAR